jgi:hypothetical protein
MDFTKPNFIHSLSCFADQTLLSINRPTIYPIFILQKTRLEIYLCVSIITSNSGRKERRGFSCLQHVQTNSGGPTDLLFSGYGGNFARLKRPGVKETTTLRRVRRLSILNLYLCSLFPWGLGQRYLCLPLVRSKPYNSVTGAWCMDHR